jgi:aldehyde reductase
MKINFDCIAGCINFAYHRNYTKFLSLF